MNILALETATDNCSVALSISGEIHVKTELAPRKQAQLLLPMVDAVLAEAGIARTQLDALVFGQGPGSFTGLRVACLLYTSPSPRDRQKSRMPSSA